MKRTNLNIMGQLILLVKPLLPFMLLAIFMGVTGFLCSIFITILGGYAMLEVLQINSTFSFSIIFTFLLIFAVLRGFLRYGEQYNNHYIAFKILALIRDQVFRALRRLCPAKLESRDKGNLITVITSDIELLEVFYAHTISPIVIAFFVSGFMSFFIGQYHWLLGCIAAIAYLILGIAVPFIVSKRSGNSGMAYRTMSGDLSSFVLENLRGLKETIQYNVTDQQLNELTMRTDALSKQEAILKQNTGKNTALTYTIILSFHFIMLVSSSLLFMQGQIGFDAVLICTLAMISSFGPVTALANLGSTLQNTLAAGNRILDILEESPSVEEVTNKEEVTFSGAACDHVSFAYQKELILSNINLSFPRNKVIGITGKSGCGKSTLLKLLMRFWNADKGIVKISDTNIQSINTSSLRSLESYVTQETHLFHDTIENNIRIAKLDATQSEIEEACKKSSIHDFILTLPKGYQSNVGELGNMLSGGERQRIGLARVFLHNAPFILLDEPTSNLDSLNEAIILNSLHKERKGKTIVLVSHRESTLRIADIFHSIEQGRLS